MKGKRKTKTSVRHGIGRPETVGPVVIAVFLYVVLAAYLFGPYVSGRWLSTFLYGLHSVAGALGCYVVSRRWIASFGGSLFSGALYGFGPFLLSFSAYHPVAGLPAALLPWMFCPAVYYHARQNKTPLQRILSILLAVLPFVAVAAFFGISADAKAYPMPVQIRAGLEHVSGVVMPLMGEARFSLSVYHVGLAALTLGIMMYVIVRRISVLVIVGVSVLLSLAGPVFEVPPVFWLAVPMLYAAVLTGMGMQGLAWAGASDRRWLYACTAVVGVLAVVLLALFAFQGRGQEYRVTGLLYAVGAVMTGCIVFLARSGLRWNLFRWILLCGGVGIDIIYSSRYVVDGIF